MRRMQGQWYQGAGNATGRAYDMGIMGDHVVAALSRDGRLKGRNII